MNKLFWTLILLILLGGAMLSLRLSPTKEGETGQLNVFTSFYPLYYFTSQLIGNNVSLTNVTPAGTEPHEYEPSPKEIARISNSQLLVLNGGGFEPWAETIETTQTRVVYTGKALISKEIIEDGQKTADPHIWLSPRLAKRQAQQILEALISLDPENTDEYKKKGQILNSRFDALDRKFAAGLKNCQRRDFVTSHEAFSYLADAYDLNQIAISGVSPEEEPSLQELARISDFARKNGIKYIFFETLVSPKLSETLAQEVGAETLVLNPIEGLSDEDMKAGKNYFTIMEENLANLRTALVCR